MANLHHHTTLLVLFDEYTGLESSDQYDSEFFSDVDEPLLMSKLQGFMMLMFASSQHVILCNGFR